MLKPFNTRTWLYLNLVVDIIPAMDYFITRSRINFPSRRYAKNQAVGQKVRRTSSYNSGLIESFSQDKIEEPIPYSKS